MESNTGSKDKKTQNNLLANTRDAWQMDGLFWQTNARPWRELTILGMSRKFAPGSRSILPNSASRWKTFLWLLIFARNTESFGDGISRGRMSDSFNSLEHTTSTGRTLIPVNSNSLTQHAAKHWCMLTCDCGCTQFHWFLTCPGFGAVLWVGCSQHRPWCLTQHWPGCLT